MRPVALGWKTHSGWAALVVLATQGSEVEVLDRRRVELVDPADVYWAKQPYHAAEGLDREDARDVVKRAVAAAKKSAAREMRAALARAREAGQDVEACAVLAGTPMPEWTVDEILAVHFRMHKAEGVLWSDALLGAARACEVRCAAVLEKQLAAEAKRALGVSAAATTKKIASIGREIGPPWGADQKKAALAACIALRADT
jgi:hypothetical protein